MDTIDNEQMAANLDDVKDKVMGLAVKETLTERLVDKMMKLQEAKTIAVLNANTLQTKYDELEEKYNEKEKSLNELKGKYAKLAPDETKKQHDRLKMDYEILQGKYDRLETQFKKQKTIERQVTGAQRFHNVRLEADCVVEVADKMNGLYYADSFVAFVTGWPRSLALDLLNTLARSDVSVLGLISWSGGWKRVVVTTLSGLVRLVVAFKDAVKNQFRGLAYYDLRRASDQSTAVTLAEIYTAEGIIQPVDTTSWGIHDEDKANILEMLRRSYNDEATRSDGERKYIEFVERVFGPK